MTVEDQIVVAADLVDEQKGSAMSTDVPLDQLEPPRGLRQFERAGRDVDKRVDAGLRQQRHRIGKRARRDVVGGRFIAPPGVLADVQPEPPPGNPHRRDPIGGAEITLLVEDVVIGQEHLVDGRRDASVLEHTGGVGDAATGNFAMAGMPDDHGQPLRQAGGQLVDRSVAGGDKPFPQQQILGGIPAHEQLGGDEQVGPRGARRQPRHGPARSCRAGRRRSG